MPRRGLFFASSSWFSGLCFGLGLFWLGVVAGCGGGVRLGWLGVPGFRLSSSLRIWMKCCCLLSAARWQVDWTNDNSRPATNTYYGRETRQDSPYVYIIWLYQCICTNFLLRTWKGKYLCMNSSYCRMYLEVPYDGSLIYLYEYIKKNIYIYIYTCAWRDSLLYLRVYIYLRSSRRYF